MALQKRRKNLDQPCLVLQLCKARAGEPRSRVQVQGAQGGDRSALDWRRGIAGQARQDFLVRVATEGRQCCDRRAADFLVPAGFEGDAFGCRAKDFELPFAGESDRPGTQLDIPAFNQGAKRRGHIARGAHVADARGGCQRREQPGLKRIM